MAFWFFLTTTLAVRCILLYGGCLSYLDYLKKFKQRQLSLVAVAALEPQKRLELAVELLAFVRFEPDYLNDSLMILKKMLPQLPEADRLLVLKEMDALLEDCHACLGKKSLDYLDAMVLLSLSEEQRMGYAQHLLLKLSEQRILQSEFGLFGLLRLCPLLSLNQKQMILPKVLSFVASRTLPDKDLAFFLQSAIAKSAMHERRKILDCWLQFLESQFQKEKVVLLFLEAFQDLHSLLNFEDKKLLIEALKPLFTHSHRKVVERVLDFYSAAVDDLPIEYKFEPLQELMKHDNQIEHLDTICDILKKQVQALLCPKQKQSVNEFLNRFQSQSLESPIP